MEKKTLYDVEKRGAPAPEYTPIESTYRNRIISGLQNSLKIRELNHMELDGKTYWEYYLINRQQDYAYNPPKRSAADVRLNSGVIHEKDSTLQSIVTDMNFQPKVRVFDKDDELLEDVSAVFTAKLKKTLIQDDFKEKLSEFVRLNISQGNVFVNLYRNKKYTTKKVKVNKTDDPTQLKWKTVVEEQDFGCTAESIPNTAVYLSDILQKDIKKQPRIWVVRHIPTEFCAQVYKDFPNWKYVPKSPTQTVPVNTDGIWGDYFLRRPAIDYMEVIMTQSEAENDYNIFLNGVMMYPIQDENGLVTGFPLSEISPSGEFTIVKGNNGSIPFFAYGRSQPSRTEVKEESVNELMRLMFYKIRQSAKPPVGNNTDRVLPLNIWDPGVITPDISKEDISILTPNAGVTQQDFSFYKLLMDSIDDSTVSATVEGSNNAPNVTATQYVDQKKQDLKKIGLLLDDTIAFLQDMFWLMLFQEIYYIGDKQKYYSQEDDKFIEAYKNFTVAETIDGSKGTTKVNLMDDTSNVDPEKLFQQEEQSANPVRNYFARPAYLQQIIMQLRDKIYIDVVSEPDGEQSSLLGMLFNILTQYVNLKGGDNSDVNFEYLQKVIDQIAGFDPGKIFLKNKPQPQPMPGMPPQGMQQPGMQPQPGPGGKPLPPGVQPNGGTAGIIPMNVQNNQQNPILANAK